MDLSVEEDRYRKKFFAPERNRDFTKQDLAWFTNNRGNKVYRTSIVEEGMCYRLKLMPRRFEERKNVFVLFHGKTIPKGCGEWRVKLTTDNLQGCMEDEKRLFESQDLYGARFCNRRFKGMRVNKLTI